MNTHMYRVLKGLVKELQKYIPIFYVKKAISFETAFLNIYEL